MRERNGRSWRGLAMLVALAGGVAAQILVSRQPYAARGWVAYVLTYLLFAAAAGRRSFSRLVPSIRSARTRVGDHPNLFFLVIAIAAVAAATLMPAAGGPPVLALLAWILGLAFATLAVRRWRVSEQRAAEAWSKSETLGFAAVVLLAALARFMWIETLPGRYFDDEARVGLYLLEMTHKGVADFFTLGWNAWPVLGIAAQGSLGAATEMSTTTLRLVSAAFGTLAVATTYLAARTLFSPRVALLAAFFLAINRTAIDISRLGTCHAQVMALAPLAFTMWWRGINTGTASSYLGAGIVMGLCLYTYNAGQLVVVVWLVWAAFAALSSRDRLAYRTGAALSFLGFCLTIAPLAFRVTDGFRFGSQWQQWLSLGRGRQLVTSVGDLVRRDEIGEALKLLRDQASATWLGFFTLPSKAYALGYRDGGMSDDVTAALFLLGLGLCVLVRFGARGAFVASWFGVTALFASVLTRDPPVFQRLVGVLPAVAILAALPLECLLPWAHGSRRKLALSGSLIAGLAAVAIWQNWRTYFVEFAQQPLDFPSMLARTLRELPADRPVILSGSEYSWHATGWLQNQLSFQHELIRLDFRDRDLREAVETADVLPLRSDSTPPPVIIFGPTQVGQTEYVRQLYPTARIRTVGHGLHVFAVAEIPAADILAVSGLRLSRISSQGSTDLGVEDPFAPRIIELCDDAAPCTFEWTGSIYWPSSALVGLRLTGDGIEQVRLAGTELPMHGEPAMVSMQIRLPRGWQPFAVRQAAGWTRPWLLQLRRGGISTAAGRADFMADASAHGLSATYKRDGRTLGRSIDAQLNYITDERFFGGRVDLRFRLPFEARWHGGLRIEAAGPYEFELHTGGVASVELGGSRLFKVGDVPQERVAVRHTKRQLDVGVHEISASWKAKPPYPGTPSAVFQLYWRPPGGEKQLVPPTSFAPDASPPRLSAIESDWCDNDCERDGTWTVDEVVRVATVALGIRPLATCPTADVSKDGQISVEEIVAAVTQALNGCN